MVSENVEVVRSAISEFTPGGLRGSSDLYAPDAVVDLSRALGPYRGIYEGDSVWAVWSEFHEQWEATEYEVVDYLESGDHVVTSFTQRLRGRDGIEVTATGTWLWTLSDGLITRLCLYQEREEALAAAGISSGNRDRSKPAPRRGP